MRIASLLAAAAVFAGGCSKGNLKTPDLAMTAPADMTPPAIAATQLAPAATRTNCLAADDTRVYWSDSSGAAPQIVSLPFTGSGATVTALVTGGDADACVAVDGNGAYYFDDGKLMKVP